MQQTDRPSTIDELMQRSYAMAGRTIGEIAESIGQVPEKLLHYKGWFGQLVETVLGAYAGSSPVQDFTDLGVELKTIPLDHECYPQETTFVCATPLLDISGTEFRTSNVYNKMKRVLWVPFSGARDIPVASRIVYTPFLWQPDELEYSLLETDWNEHMERIATGEIERITARDGAVLQIRPKAADGKALTRAIGRNGTYIMTRPRGFYLRKCFTGAIIDRQYGILRADCKH
ncbi:MAG: DNA mismatch repair endonuclease MutH [Succinivibrionaceae bacterium]|nr:DNA mismatch repair endonuclease MutH [Succinivibrionaceae bacterium]